MSEEGEHLARRMAADGSKTVSYFEGLTAEERVQQVYTTGSEWTVRDILAHFVSAERAFHKLLADILAGGDGAPRDMDIVEFNEREVPALGDRSWPDLLADFREARKASVQIATKMTDADLKKHGYHPWFGDVDLASMAKLIYRHNMIHLRDIRRALKRRAPVAHLDLTPPSAQKPGGAAE